VKLTGYTVATFTAAKQTIFQFGIATIAQVSVADVTIISITASAARRQLLAAGIEVGFSIKNWDLASAKVFTETINNATAVNMATMIAQFKLAGLTEIESVIVTSTPSITMPSPSPPPSPPPVIIIASSSAKGAKSFLTAVAVLIAAIASLV